MTAIKLCVAAIAALFIGQFIGLDFVIDPALNYPANLVCHARRGDYYYNNPLGIRCVNVERWQKNRCDHGDDYFCSKQKFWAVYRNEDLN